jgi:hypothetical protein
MEGLSGCSAPVLTIKTVTNVRSPGKYKRINEHLDEVEIKTRRREIQYGCVPIATNLVPMISTLVIQNLHSNMPVMYPLVSVVFTSLK